MSFIFQPQHVPKHFLFSKLPEPKGCNPSQKGHFSLPDANKHCCFPGSLCCLPSVLARCFLPISHVAHPCDLSLWPQSSPLSSQHIPPHLTPQCPVSHQPVRARSDCPACCQPGTGQGMLPMARACSPAQSRSRCPGRAQPQELISYYHKLKY